MDQGKLYIHINWRWVCSATRRPRHATEEEVRYLLQIQGVLNNTQDPNERHILIKNINEELRGSEVSLASNKKTSYVVQTILENCNRDQLRLFLSYSKGTFEIRYKWSDFAIHMFTQTYASHPMQTALEMANKFLSESVEEDQHALMKRMDEEPLESLVDLVNIFVENILPSLSIVCCDVNGSHVIRYLLCILMGCPSSCGTIKKHIVKGSLEKKVPSISLFSVDERHSAGNFWWSSKCSSVCNCRIGVSRSRVSHEESEQLLHRPVAYELSSHGSEDKISPYFDECWKRRNFRETPSRPHYRFQWQSFAWSVDSFCFWRGR